MKKVLFALGLVGSLSIADAAFAQQQEKAATKFGLGLATNFGATPVDNALVARAKMDKITLQGALGFRTQSGDFNEGTGFGIGVSGQYNVFSTDNLDFHVLGGLAYNRDSAYTESTITTGTPPTVVTVTTKTTNTVSDISLFGGLGAQYWFPGTRRFSMQIDVGPAIHLYGQSVETKAGTTTTTTDSDAFALSLAENLSSGILFTYWFAD